MALLLHYLFLSAFCWMLCEGILLYLLLVVVFSRLSHQWWLFLLIGYGEISKVKSCGCNLFFSPVQILGWEVGRKVHRKGDVWEME